MGRGGVEGRLKIRLTGVMGLLDRDGTNKIKPGRFYLIFPDKSIS